MTYFADLTPCDYFTPDHEGKLLAVGWLDRKKRHTRGDVSKGFILQLHRLLVSPWDQSAFLGYFDCPFCRVSSGPRQLTIDNTTVELGNTNLFIPGDSVVFVAPSLILHYIDAHEYAPPQSFCEAVLACPEMRSMDYLKRIRATAPLALFS
jgi:hypothetical protein